MENIKKVHCSGIGGAGMSGIAEILKAQGYEVTGSEKIASQNTDRLSRLGIPIHFQPSVELVTKADLLVYSSAIPSDHPERKKAYEKGIPSVSRGEMLGNLMQHYSGIAVAGTHGKTSTVGLIAKLFEAQQLNPTVVVGGYLKHINSHATLGASRYFITEADESDGSLLFLHPEIAVVTNIEEDHMGYYHYDLKRLIQAYHQFMTQSGKWVVLCEDDPILAKMKPNMDALSVTSYGFTQSASIQGAAFQQYDGYFSLCVSRDKLNRSELVLDVPLLGKHNAYNALAAVTVATLLGISDRMITEGLSAYKGVARRLDRLGAIKVDKGKVEVIDDYAHHPTEIKASIEAVRSTWPGRRIVLVFQLHRYTRTRDLWRAFVEVLAEAADCLLLFPLYTAGEVPIRDIDHTQLAAAIQKKGKEVRLVKKETLYDTLHSLIQKEDILVFQGAGDISQIGKNFYSTWKAQEGV